MQRWKQNAILFLSTDTTIIGFFITCGGEWLTSPYIIELTVKGRFLGEILIIGSEFVHVALEYHRSDKIAVCYVGTLIGAILLAP